MSNFFRILKYYLFKNPYFSAQPSWQVMLPVLRCCKIASKKNKDVFLERREAAISGNNNIIPNPSPAILKKIVRKIDCFPLSFSLNINVPFLFRIIYLQTRQIVRYTVTTNPTRQFVSQQLN